MEDLADVLDESDAVPAHERVYRALRVRILDGAMAPGEAITLRGIADQLSVSMTPAREAVRRLAAERALEITATGRIHVPDPSREALDELFAARLLLEPELARRALPRADDALIARLDGLDGLIDHAMEDGSPTAYIRANNAFHAVLYGVAEAPALMALVESVWMQTAPTMRRVYGRLGTAQMVDQHQEALKALRARDEAALIAAVESDILQGQKLLGSETS